MGSLLSKPMPNLITAIMKISKIVPFALVVVSLLAGPGAMYANEGGAVSPPGQAQLSDAEMLEIYGWMAGMRAGISRLGLTEEELAAFSRGIDAARSNRDLDVDLQAVGPLISQFVQMKFDAHMARLKAEEEAKAEAYWAEVLQQEGVESLPSGLAYKILAPGNDVKPTATDTVRVHYTGKLIDGKVFDTSDGGGPFTSRLDEVIEGWTQGVPLIGEGGSMKLYIPAKLGYGDAGSGQIPPGATLIFEVELLEVVKPRPAAEVGAPE
jgi:FKBP-type peptidyl-prolyl cis-trans isomerase